MKTTMRAAKGNEVVAGWVVQLETGRREFYRGISRAGAMRIAAGNDSVVWVRQFAIESGVYVILA